MKNCSLINAFVILPLITCSLSFGQTRKIEPFRMQQNVEPAFRVTPIVHHFKSRRGKVIPFEFAIESINRPTTIHVRAIALAQDVNGSMIPKTDTPAPDSITLLSPAEMNLADNEQKLLRGRVKVPFTDSKFHSFGILVTDLGRIVGTAPVATQEKEERRVGIRFVTRYVLRVDLTVQGVRGGDITKLELQSSELFEEEGKAKARVWVHNPTDSPFEFQIRARLANSAVGSRQKQFNLCMPVRENVEPPERWTIRILPDSRLRLQEFLPEAVFPGDYEMQVDLISNNRTRMKKAFPISISKGDFPAQDATIVQVVRDITVTPSQLELSLRKRGNRFVPLEIANTSKQAITVNLTPKTNSETAEWLMVRPNAVTLRAGSKRKSLVTLNSKSKIEKHQYGSVRIDITPDEGEAIGHFSVPVALLSRSDEKSNLELEQLSLDDQSEQPAFVVPVTNTGAMHVPLNATLELGDSLGRPIELEAGFGRWLLPGKSSHLRFRTKFAPSPGQYQYKLHVNSGDQSEPLELEGAFQISGQVEENVSTKSAEPTPAS